MQLRLDQLQAHLAKGLRRVYTIHGDEPLQAQEAADAIRAAARVAGHAARDGKGRHRAGSGRTFGLCKMRCVRIAAKNDSKVGQMSHLF